MAKNYSNGSSCDKEGPMEPTEAKGQQNNNLLAEDNQFSKGEGQSFLQTFWNSTTSMLYRKDSTKKTGCDGKGSPAHEFAVRDNVSMDDFDLRFKHLKKYGSFHNPEDWKFHLPRLGPLVRWKWQHKTLKIEDKKEFVEKYRLHKPNKDDLKKVVPNGVRALWIGHASMIVQIDGYTILTDPVFSEFVGFYGKSKIGYQRYQDAAITVKDMTGVVFPSAVLISHNHYDHLDTESVKELSHAYDKLIWVVPKGMKNWFEKLGCCYQIVELDWWERYKLPVKRQDGPEIIFTPAKHWSWRFSSVINNTSLWGSWVVKGSKGSKFFFAGDTGYQKELFQEIGKKYGRFDLAAIPIGAYEPREVMECQHVDPIQAVEIHKDIQSNRSIGIHWGTFFLSDEKITDPPDIVNRLVEESNGEVDFVTCCPGQFVDGVKIQR